MVIIYMALLVSISICLFQNIPKVFVFQIQNCLFFLDLKYFYEMAIRWIIVITSYNNAVLYIHIFLKKTTDKLRLDFVRQYLFYFLWSRLVLDSRWFVLTRVGLVLIRVDLCQTYVDLCQTRVDSCWLVLICVDSCWPVLILGF